MVEEFTNGAIAVHGTDCPCLPARDLVPTDMVHCSTAAHAVSHRGGEHGEVREPMAQAQGSALRTRAVRDGRVSEAVPWLRYLSPHHVGVRRGQGRGLRGAVRRLWRRAEG